MVRGREGRKEGQKEGRTELGEKGRRDRLVVDIQMDRYRDVCSDTYGQTEDGWMDMDNRMHGWNDKDMGGWINGLMDG